MLEKENILPSILTGASARLSAPIPSTTKIFAPRTEDMDSGFLMPCDNTLIGNYIYLLFMNRTISKVHILERGN
jgi:hypothetical protein